MPGLRLAARALVVAIVASSFATPAQGAPGDLDRRFGRNGVTPLIGGRIEASPDLAAKGPGGSITVIGHACTHRVCDGRTNLGMARFNLGPVSATHTDVGTGGSTVLLGQSVPTYSHESFERSLMAAKLSPDGTVDRSFGTRGRVTLQTMTGEADDWARAVGIRLLPDGAILMAVLWHDGHPILGRPSLQRLRPDGSADPGFGFQGYGGFVRAFNTSHDLGAMDVLPDGRILTVGTYSTVDEQGLFVARHLANGRPDLEFGSQGVIHHPSASSMEIHGMRAHADRSITVTGRDGVRTLVIARLRSDGSMVPSFGSEGVARVTRPNGMWHVAIDTPGVVFASAMWTHRPWAWTGDVTRIAGGVRDQAWGDGGLRILDRWFRAGSSGYVLVPTHRGLVVIGPSTRRPHGTSAVRLQR